MVLYTAAFFVGIGIISVMLLCTYRNGYNAGCEFCHQERVSAADEWQAKLKADREQHKAEIESLKKRHRESLRSIWHAVHVAMANDTETGGDSE